jgi:hypothetical protein
MNQPLTLPHWSPVAGLAAAQSGSPAATASHVERFSKSASNSARLEKFDTDVMVSSPNDPARPTRVRRSGQMQSKAFRQIVNVANRQACT